MSLYLQYLYKVFFFSFPPGLGAGIGYIINGINWEQTILGNTFKQLQVVFIFNGALCVLSVFLTLCSIKETPLNKTKNKTKKSTKNLSNQYDNLYNANNHQQQYGTFLESGQSSVGEKSPLLGRRSHRSSSDEDTDLEWDNTFDFHHFDMPLPRQTSYHRRIQLMQSIRSENDLEVKVRRSKHAGSKSTTSLTDEETDAPASALQLLYSVVRMPPALRRLCFSIYLAWLAFATILLFFTDYVGQVVYHGELQRYCMNLKFINNMCDSVTQSKQNFTDLVQITARSLSVN